MEETNWYWMAQHRISETEELGPHEEVLLYDWLDDAHFQWVATAPVAEIVDWATTVEMYT